jgi:hypothetical protein
MTTFEKQKILDQLQSLKTLPQVKEVKALKKRLEKELERINETIKPEKIEVSKEEKQIIANARRSSHMKKKWNYVRQIYFNYPEISENYGLREIFLMYSKRRKGQKIPIDDVYWQNPSL